MATIVINLYCLVTFATKRDLLKLEYFLVGLQTVIDLLVNGFYGLIFSLGSAIYNLETYCGVSYDYYADYLDEVRVFLSIEC